jgi:hypothetical protein
VRHICGKIGVSNRGGTAVFALEQGILPEWRGRAMRRPPHRA